MKIPKYIEFHNKTNCVLSRFLKAAEPEEGCCFLIGKTNSSTKDHKRNIWEVTHIWNCRNIWGEQESKLIEKKIPIFGICLGHQILSLALGAKTKKMSLGHRGANHPVKDLSTSKVEITSQNHGFEVDPKSIPSSVNITHKSLFDGCVEGIEVKEKKVFSVQYHPEANPGPQDSKYLFDKFLKNIIAAKKNGKKKRY